MKRQVKDLLHVEDPRPLLVVHIGGAKSGSTAIQDFLFANSVALMEMGCAVPNTEFQIGPGPTNQIWFFQKMVDQDIAGTPEASRIVVEHVNALWDTLSKRPTPARGIVLSAENLSNNKGLHETFRALKERFRLAIILYVRRQEDFYHSAWQQWFVKELPSINTWLKDWDGESCDWNGTLERWENIAPDSITVRIFDRSLLTGGDVIDDFCDVLGLDIEGLRRPFGDVNVSYGAHVSDLYHSMAPIFEGIHDHSVEDHLHRLGVTATRRRRGEWLFTREQLDFIRNRHAPGNARVKAKYFADAPERELFFPVLETDTFAPTQTEFNRRNIGVLGELSIRQYREMEGRIQEILKRLDEIDQKCAAVVAERGPSVDKGNAAPSFRPRKRWWPF